MSIAYERLGAEALDRIDAVAALYGQVFAEPPYNEGPEDTLHFRRAFKREVQEPGFVFVAAVDEDEAPAELVGMAYGYTMPAGEWWRNAEPDPPTEIMAAPHFAVMEWAVRPDRQREGIGRELMDWLLADRGEPWATLNVNPNAPARDIYLAAGWEPCGVTRNRRFPDMDVLALKLEA